MIFMKNLRLSKFYKVKFIVMYKVEKSTRSYIERSNLSVDQSTFTLTVINFSFIIILVGYTIWIISTNFRDSITIFVIGSDRAQNSLQNDML